MKKNVCVCLVVFFSILNLHAQHEFNKSSGFIIKIYEKSKLYVNIKYFFIPDSIFSSDQAVPYFFSNEFIPKAHHYIGRTIWLSNWNNVDELIKKNMDSLFKAKEYHNKLNKVQKIHIVHAEIIAVIEHIRIKDYLNSFISSSVSGVNPNVGSEYLYTDVFEISSILSPREILTVEEKKLGLYLKK